MQVSLFVFQEFRQCKLNRTIAGKTIELVDLSEFLHPFCRCDTITHLPSGTMIYFPKRKTNKASFQQIGVSKHGKVKFIIKYQVLIYFIADDKNSCVFYQCLELFNILFYENTATWIMRRVQQDRPRFGRNFLSDLLPV